MIEGHAKVEWVIEELTKVVNVNEGHANVEWIIEGHVKVEWMIE